MHSEDIKAAKWLELNPPKLKDFCNTVHLLHTDGTELRFKHAFIRKVTSRLWWVFTEHNGNYIAFLGDLCFISETRDKKVISRYVGAIPEVNVPYLQKLGRWTLELQRRYIELIKRHACMGKNTISSLELIELYWMSAERQRLKYPILDAEKEMLVQVRAKVRKMFRKYRKNA